MLSTMRRLRTSSAVLLYHNFMQGMNVILRTMHVSFLRSRVSLIQNLQTKFLNEFFTSKGVLEI